MDCSLPSSWCSLSDLWWDCGVVLVLLILCSSPLIVLLCFARSQHLEEVAASLRERIKHLDDMVHCQQKKVKHMVEEVRSNKTLTSLLGTLIPLAHNRKRILFCVQFPYATLVTNIVQAVLSIWSYWSRKIRWKHFNLVALGYILWSWGWHQFCNSSW